MDRATKEEMAAARAQLERAPLVYFALWLVCFGTYWLVFEPPPLGALAFLLPLLFIVHWRRLARRQARDEAAGE